MRLLEGYQGVLQTDGYAGYNRGCWDNARRKFVDASQAAPAKYQGDKVSNADITINKIHKLYSIKSRIEGLSAAQKNRTPSTTE